MTGIDPDRLERRLRWAAEQLGLSPHASLDEVRAAWLRRLPEEDFVPSSELRWALAALLRRQPEKGWETRADEAAFAAEEERLRGEVEAFAEQFWALPTDERRRRWQELTDRCAFAPALRARLHLLEAGLAIDPSEPNEDARVIELARHVRELFVLRPGPRARTRQDILRRIAGDSLTTLTAAPKGHILRRVERHRKDDRKEWKAAVRRLRRAHPRLAALGGDLLDKIAITAPKPKPLPRIMPPQFASAVNREVRPRTVFWLLVVGGMIGLCGGILNSNHKAPSPSVQFPNTSFQPEEGKKVPPEVWKHLMEPQPFQNEEFKERLKKIFVEQEKARGRGKDGEKRDKQDGKIP